ncbi:hypothetical protein MN116_008809, partial [Schistosoma mekongi]
MASKGDNCSSKLEGIDAELSKIEEKLSSFDDCRKRTFDLLESQRVLSNLYFKMASPIPCIFSKLIIVWILNNILACLYQLLSQNCLITLKPIVISTCLFQNLENLWI